VLFGIFAEARNVLYDIRFFRSLRFRSYVIGIGSLSVGGSGKTPLVEYLAERLFKKGVSVGVISNGFRKKSSGLVIVSDGKKILENVFASGDEAYLMAVNFLEAGAEIPVISCSDRIKGVQILEERFQCNAIVIDDSFQYRKLEKNVEFIVQDYLETSYPNFTLPVGRLREFKRNLNRAEAVVISKAPDCFNEQVLSSKWGKKVCFTHYKPLHFQNCFEPDKQPLEMLSGKKVILFFGLGHNESFASSIRDLCSRYDACIARSFEFQDHHWYTLGEIQKIFDSLNGIPLDQCMVLTTQKDAVKIKAEWVPLGMRSKVFFLRSEFRFESQNQFENLIKIPHI
jgi:tetraacyldisaccharide 4'-kinase